MTSKHTPGPWVVHDHPTDPYQFGHYVTTADGLTVCSVAHQLPGRSPHGAEESTRAANARLIAAAPELLDAAQEALGFAVGFDGISRNNAENLAAELADQLRAAIAKATGEGA